MVMDEKSIKTNLMTLKEAILDEQKLVTYISLSKELCIHVNESKSLLNTLVTDLKKNRPDTELNISYILSGLSDNNEARTTVCSEINLESLRSNLKTVYFQHVYSVSQGPPDNAAFVAVSKFEDLSLCTGFIRSNACKKRSSDEVGNVKSKTSYQDPEIEPIKNSILKKQFSEKYIKDVKNIPEDSKNALEICDTKSVPNIKTEVQSPKKDLQNVSKSLSKRNGDKNKPKSIAGFFAKANANSNKKPLKVDVQDTVNKVEKEQNKKEAVIKLEKEDNEKDPVVKVEKVVKESQEVEIEKMDIDEVSVKHVEKEITTTKGKSKNSSLNEIKKNRKVENKRKRVLRVSDSESDDEKNDPFADEPNHVDHESEDEIPPTPSTNTVKITSGIVNPKKRRKIVDKTYTDEEGYILTKKEEIYESCSDHEDEVVAKENVQHVNKIKQETSPKEKKTKNSKKKSSPSSQQKANQPTMMNFFKKM